MQGNLLRVFVFGLIVYPRDEPATEEQGDVVFEQCDERTFKDLQTMDNEIRPGNEKTMSTDAGRSWDISAPLLLDQNVSGQDGTDSQEDYMPNTDMHCERAESKGKIIIQSHTSEEVGSKMVIADWEGDYLWGILNLFSFISVISFFRKYLRNGSKTAREKNMFSAAEVLLPDSGALHKLHSKSLRLASRNKWREEEFLEGFLDDLLKSMRAACDTDASLVIGDFQIVDVCDVIVPLTLPHPFTFDCVLCRKQATDFHLCGRIQLVEKNVRNGCLCQSPDAEDMVCLLHGENKESKAKACTEAFSSHFCVRNSSFLSKSRVSRWFRSITGEAWAEISHKYKFDLITHAPGSLVVRFQSGKKLRFNLRPVFKLDSESYLYILPSSSTVDATWTVSLRIYEDQLLRHVSLHLPENSCHFQTLEAVCFLVRGQETLSGSSALTAWHCKLALTRLLCATKPEQWKSEFVADRLRDLLVFLERSLREKFLCHVLIGNPLAQNAIALPDQLTFAKPVNLFHPLMVNECIYRNALTFFQEMLRNAKMQILDYVGNFDDSST
ncbi:inositol 1,4,5-trisphosphate receptor-interacting protein [Nerophis ophidion]|uniref:inositol 1,4,5-trisphosphate receptor-interacting protein n=1 Tax=Nerophis ophidion TaxID=159077 RepID=UPI002AE0359C|nr:inositol 1,4,5-trisphosphate receptor-interacting protein [Nerophis ophidion]XP_061736947.1 inositol 1,4,5-trisphosphate receptor-interacting protein [Nerophis ophidion]